MTDLYEKMQRDLLSKIKTMEAEHKIEVSTLKEAIQKEKQEVENVRSNHNMSAYLT
jgi:hypothetical protein